MVQSSHNYTLLFPSILLAQKAKKNRPILLWPGMYMHVICKWCGGWGLLFIEKTYMGLMLEVCGGHCSTRKGFNSSASLLAVTVAGCNFSHFWCTLYKKSASFHLRAAGRWFISHLSFCVNTAVRIISIIVNTGLMLSNWRSRTARCWRSHLLCSLDRFIGVLSSEVEKT